MFEVPVEVMVLVKLVYYVTSLTAIGISFHISLGIGSLKDVRIRRILIALAPLVIAFTIIRLLLLNAELGGAVGMMFSSDMFEWVWRSNSMQVLTIFAGAGIVFFGALRKFIPALILGAVVLAASYGLSGHAQALDNPGFAPVMVVFHAFLAGFWIASPLSLFPRREASATSIFRVERFSTIAILLVPILFVTGIYLIFSLAGDGEKIVRTTYGKLLLLKLLLATGALAMGAINKLWVTKALKINFELGRLQLRKALIIEACIFGIIVFIITWITVVTGTS